MSKTKYPPVRSDMHEVELAAMPSVRVIVRPVKFGGLWFGRYFHGIGEWQVDGITSSSGVEVAEWWPLPEEGTGVNVEGTK